MNDEDLVEVKSAALHTYLMTLDPDLKSERWHKLTASDLEELRLLLESV